MRIRLEPLVLDAGERAGDVAQPRVPGRVRAARVLNDWMSAVALPVLGAYSRRAWTWCC
jgi:hypothetical protein